MRGKKAFLLFEVTLAVAILSAGLVFVIRSISMSMQVARVSSNYSEAINLAYNRLSELELESQISGLEMLESSGKFLEDQNYNWKYTIERLEEENLDKLNLEVSWQEGKRTGSFNIITFLKTKTKE